MTWCMARRRKDSHAAVAEHVAVTFKLGHGMLRLESRRVVGTRPFVFGLLHVKHGGWKHLDIADVVGMGVRDRHRLDVGWLHSELIELSRQRLGPAPMHGLGISRSKTIRHNRNGVCDTG